MRLTALRPTTDDDFPEIADGAEPLWTVGTPPVIFHSTGIKANKVGLALPSTGTGFTAAECNSVYGDGKASVRVTSDPANGQPVVQRICAVEWRRSAAAPGLSHLEHTGPFTERGSNCVLSQSPPIADTPLPAGQHLCSDLFGNGGTGFANLEANRVARTNELNVILTSDRLTYTAGAGYYILSGNDNDVYDIYGLPINSETYAPDFQRWPNCGG